MASGDVKLREPSGIINGTNVDFTTPENYISGSIQLFWNGLLIQKDGDDSIIETGPNTFRMKVAPSKNDILHVRYIEE